MLPQAAEALRDVIRPPKSVSRNSGRMLGATSEAPPVAARVVADAASAELQHESAAAQQLDSRPATAAIDGAHRLIGRHADVPAPSGRTTDLQAPTQAQLEVVRSQSRHAPPLLQPQLSHFCTWCSPSRVSFAGCFASRWSAGAAPHHDSVCRAGGQGA